MKITQHLEEKKGKTLYSLEIVPPMKGEGIQSLYDNLDPLMALAPCFVDVTTSREQYVYLERGGGLVERRISRMRPGTLGICAAVQHKYSVDTVPHVLCGGYTVEETEYLLVDCMYLGIDNLMALRGDPMHGEKSFVPAQGGHHYARELVSHIGRVGRGQFLTDPSPVAESSRFCVGVAGYPEKHIEAPSLATDLQRLKEKVDAGADYVVTQMFFDNNKYFEFVEKARALGISVPILPGLKPLLVKSHLHMLPKTFKIDLPDPLSRAVEKAPSAQHIRQIGEEWTIAQGKELIARGAPALHFYSMGKSRSVERIVKALF